MYSLKNLALIGGATSYNKCKSDKVREIMEEFKNKELKTRNDKVVTNQKQAIAIALNQAQSSCKYNKSEAMDLIEKVNRDLNDPDKTITLSSIIETKNALENLVKLKKHKRVYMFKKMLWDKIIRIELGKLENKLNENIWNEIKKINDFN